MDVAKYRLEGIQLRKGAPSGGPNAADPKTISGQRPLRTELVEGK